MNKSKERPVATVFWLIPDQLSTLFIRANCGRGATENVIMSFDVGGQAIGILTYRESMARSYKAVSGRQFSP